MTGETIMSELGKLAGADALNDRADLARIGAALGPGIYSTPQVLAEIRRLQRRITDELEPRCVTRAEWLREIVADVEQRYPGVREPDNRSDWSKGVAWVLDRLTNIATDERPGRDGYS
jgi:hypothetical protein